MIKEKDLVPGRVITDIDYVNRSWRDGGGELLIVRAWMIIGYQTHVRRRHSRNQAPRQGWHLLLLKFGGGDRVLRDVVITPNGMREWKRLI